jgi:catechol 2,3-dioxygenase-like lactoylglutathione lyase family enzyme
MVTSVPRKITRTAHVLGLRAQLLVSLSVAGAARLQLFAVSASVTASESCRGGSACLQAADRATVRKVHKVALSYGGSCEGRPELRPHYHANYCGAYFRDPDGNKLCVACHDPEPAMGSAG